MTTHHLAIWMDHNEARILRLPAEGGSYEVEHVGDRSHHTHPRKADGAREPVDARFLAAIEERIAQADEVLLSGPAGAKDELLRHIERHRPRFVERIVAVEKADRMTDGELADHARRVFAKTDRMRGVHVGKG
jgi:stalled ribosome rescue protein Dom34